MKRCVSITLLIISGLGMNREVLAQKEKEQPLQEVFQAEVVYPQEKGSFQITTGLNLRQTSGAGFCQIPINLEYGITDRWQLGLQGSAIRTNHVVGVSRLGAGDLGIATKYSLMNVADSNSHLAIGFELSLPIGAMSKGMSEGLIQYEPFVIAARDFPGLKSLQAFTQVGLTIVQRTRHGDPKKEEPEAHEFSLTSGFFIPFRQWCITTEFNWATNKWNHAGKESRHSLTPGLVWRLSGNWEIGVGSPISLGNDSSDSRLILKVTRDF